MLVFWCMTNIARAPGGVDCAAVGMCDSMYFLAMVLFEIDTGIGNPLLNLGAYAHKKSI
jgi:hypothetical protein